VKDRYKGAKRQVKDFFFLVWNNSFFPVNACPCMQISFSVGIHKYTAQILSARIAS